MARSFFETAVQDIFPVPAPRPRVFETLLLWNSYPEWNPYITRIEGQPVVGADIQVFFFMGLGPRLPLRCRLAVVDKVKTELVWEYKAFLPWLYTARHSFVLEDAGAGRCRIMQTEAMKGLIACPLFGFFHSLLQKRFHSMHRALVERVTRSAA